LPNVRTCTYLRLWRRRRNPPGVSNHPTFTVTLRSANDKEPGAIESLLDGPDPEWVKNRKSGAHGLAHGGEIAYWSGVNMATQYPSAMSLQRLINISSAPSEPQHRQLLSDQPHDSEEERRRSRAVHDAMRLILFRVSVPDKFLVSWNSDAQHLIAMHAVNSSNLSMWPGLPNDFDTLPMVPSKQNSDLLRICKLTTKPLRHCIASFPFHYSCCLSHPVRFGVQK
jgi:hypothetical protein